MISEDALELLLKLSEPNAFLRLHRDRMLLKNYTNAGFKVVSMDSAKELINGRFVSKPFQHYVYHINGYGLRFLSDCNKDTDNETEK